MLRARPVALALCVFGVGFAVVWAGFSPIAEDPLLFCPGALEMGEDISVGSEPALWPPGTTRCEYTTASGTSSGTYVPWDEWVSLALFAAGVGVAVSALSLLPRLGLTFFLFLAAGAVLFGVYSEVL